MACEFCKDYIRSLLDESGVITPKKIVETEEQLYKFFELGDQICAQSSGRIIRTPGKNGLDVYFKKSSPCRFFPGEDGILRSEQYREFGLVKNIDLR